MIKKIFCQSRYMLHFMRDSRALPLGERLRALPGRAYGVECAMRRRLRVDELKRPYFDLCNGRHYYIPAHGADVGPATDGAVQILREAYLGASSFFRGPVQLNAGDTAVDLGGNIGTSAMTFSRRVGPTGKVYTFEPLMVEPLALNIQHHKLNNVTIVPTAVGDEDGETVFNVTDLGIDSRIAFRPNPGARKQVVPLTTLDTWVNTNQIDRLDFIKMDIEGAEELALRGARASIDRFSPKLSISSYHNDTVNEKQHPKLVALLREWGYQVTEVGTRHIYAWRDG